jgi:hypothetical protein
MSPRLVHVQAEVPIRTLRGAKAKTAAIKAGGRDPVR